jgi:hypothetical protein
MLDVEDLPRLLTDWLMVLCSADVLVGMLFSADFQPCHVDTVWIMVLCTAAFQAACPAAAEIILDVEDLPRLLSDWLMVLCSADVLVGISC